MARGKRQASASSSRLVPEDVGDTPTDNVETTESTPTTMDAGEPEAISADIVEMEDSTVETLSLPKTTVSSCKGEENAVEMAAISINRDEVEAVIEETVNVPNVTTGPVTEDRNGENVAQFALNGGTNSLMEVVSGEGATKMVTDTVEEILQEEDNGGSGNEEDTEGIHEAANHDDGLSKNGCLAGKEDEEITEETIKKKVETKQVLLRSKKRKRGKKVAIGSFKKLAFDGKNKKVHSNGDGGGENGGSTREDMMEQDKPNENTEEKKVEVSGKKMLAKKSKKRKRGKKTGAPGKSVLENASSEAGIEQISNGETTEPRKAGSKGEGGLEKGVSEGKSVGDTQDVPESSSRKKPSGKVEGMGLIFICNSETKKDCYQYNILGLPSSKREVVENIYKGMRLFLYDVDLKLMHGIYKAAAPGGFNIEPKAFKSKFPSQVRFRILEDCNPLAEEKFKKVIKKNYYTKNKFRCELTTDQVKDLCKLFKAGRRSSKPQKPGRPLKKESSKVVERNKTRKHGVDRPTRPKAERREDRVKQDRVKVVSAKKVDRNRRLSPVRENTYRDYPRHYETDHIHPFPRIPEARGSHQTLQPLPSSSTHPYVYDRRLETDAYRRVPLEVGDDPYRHDRIAHDRQHYDDPYRHDRIAHDRRHYDDLDHKSPHRDDTVEVYRRGLTNYIPRGRPSYLPGPSVHRGDYASPDEYYYSSRAIESRSAVVPHPEYRHATSTSRALSEYRSGGLHPQYRSSAGMHRYPY